MQIFWKPVDKHKDGCYITSITNITMVIKLEKEVCFMDFNKYTQKSLEAVQSCQSLAVEYGNQEIDQIHLLYALVKKRTV